MCDFLAVLVSMLQFADVDILSVSRVQVTAGFDFFNILYLQLIAVGSNISVVSRSALYLHTLLHKPILDYWIKMFPADLVLEKWGYDSYYEEINESKKYSQWRI